MLKHELTYKDFNGTEVTETLYFHLSMPELIEMEIETPGGMGEVLKQMIEAKDYKALITLFKKVLLLSYGKKSADGRHFEKSDEDRAKFSQSAAYNAMYVSLATDEAFGATFITGLMPIEMNEEVAKAIAAQGPGLVPNS